MLEAGDSGSKKPGSDYDIKLVGSWIDLVSRTSVTSVKSICAEITHPQKVEKIDLGTSPENTQSFLDKHIRGINRFYAASEFLLCGLFLHGIYNFIDGLSGGNFVDVLGGLGELVFSGGTAAYMADYWKEEKTKLGLLRETLAAKVRKGLIANLDK